MINNRKIQGFAAKHGAVEEAPQAQSAPAVSSPGIVQACQGRINNPLVNDAVAEGRQALTGAGIRIEAPARAIDAVLQIEARHPDWLEPVPLWLGEVISPLRPLGTCVVVNPTLIPGSMGRGLQDHERLVPDGERMLTLAEAVTFLSVYRALSSHWPFTGIYIRCRDRVPDSLSFADHSWSIGPFNVFAGVTSDGTIALRYVGDAAASFGGLLVCHDAE